MMKQISKWVSPWLTLTGCLWAAGGWAQINESDTLKWQLRAGLTGSYQTGNVDLLALRGRLEMALAMSPQWVFKTQNSSLYQEFGGQKADNDLFSRNYLYFRPRQEIYPFAIGYISANYRRQISFRWFAGAGLTWQVVNSARHVVKISGSVVYEETRFSSSQFNQAAYNGNEQIALARGTVYLGGWHYLGQNRMRLHYSAYWQPGLGESDNFRAQADAGLDFPVWKGLQLTALYTFTHEQVVPEKVKQKDRILTFGLSYQWRKG